MPSSRRINTTEDIREALGGATKPDRLREIDTRGMNLPTYAVLAAAANSDALLQLLDQPEGESQIKQLLDLLMAVGESQTRCEQRLSAIEATLAASAVRSRTEPATSKN